MERRVSVITLGVADLDRSVAFYRDAFGWEPSSRFEGVAFLDLDGVVLALWVHDEMAADLGVEPEPGRYRAMTLAFNTRSRAEVDAVVERAAAATSPAAVGRAPAETSWGGYAAYLVDPDGHHWEIAWNPFWVVAQDGRIELPTGSAEGPTS